MAIRASGAAARGRRSLAGRLARDRKGATAVEFGLIALPFLALMLAIVETAFVFFAGQTMENAVANSARLIRTGQAQQQGFDAETFKKDICDQVMALFNCPADLKLDVRTFKDFDSISLSKPVDANGDLKDDFTFAPGHGGDIVVVRAFYQWPVYVSLLGLDLSNMPNGTHLVSASVAFRNEPFPW